MNKKGFTLIELLAVIVILGVILVIAIPSISAAILNSRKNSYVATANEFVDGARLMALNDPSILPSTGSINIPISEIKLEKGSSTKSPFGKTYTPDSAVYINYDDANQDYIYSIYLMDDGGNGIGTKTGSGSSAVITPVDVRTVTKDTVAVGGSIPEQEPEPEPVIEPMVILSKGSPNVLLYSDITGGWLSTNSYYGGLGNENPSQSYNGYIYPYNAASYGNTKVKIYSSNKINVTNYNTITASIYAWTDSSSGFDSTLILGLKSATPTYSNTDFDYQTTTQTGVIYQIKIPFNLTLDISAVSGEYYIILGVTHPSSPSTYTVNMIVDNITLSP